MLYEGLVHLLSQLRDWQLRKFVPERGIYKQGKSFIILGHKTLMVILIISNLQTSHFKASNRSWSAKAAFVFNGENMQRDTGTTR